MAEAKTAVNLTALYTELNTLGRNGDYVRAAKVARNILQAAPNEQNALHCLVISLIQESDFKGALSAMNKNQNISEILTFERAYCLYRLTRTEEALQVLNKVANPDQRHKELKAQILYRLEKFSECFELYTDLIKNNQDDYDVEREKNLSAVMACLVLEGKSSNMPNLEESSYELCYNGAIRSIGLAKYSEAETQLRKAELLCRKTLEEDGATEEEIDEELSLIWVQLGYTVQLQGRASEAQVLYQKVLKMKPSDTALIAIAANNSATINGSQNVFDSRRKLKLARAALDGTEAKLTSRQRQALSVNQCLFLGLTSQVDLCRKAIEQLRKEYPAGLVELVLLQASLDSKSNRLEEALTTLTQFSQSASLEAGLTAALASLQLLLERRQVERAIGVLEKIVSQHLRLGILGSLVSLYSADGQRERAVNLVNQALDKVSKQKDKPENQVKLLRQAAAFHFRGGNPEKAADCLQQVLQLEPNDTPTLARLVLLYSQFDPSAAQRTSQQLPPLDLDSRLGAVDVDALETTNTWALGLKHARKAPTSGGLTSPGSGGSRKTVDAKKKKKRKIRLPKHYDPSVAPDPERWLPRRERSNYRPKKRDRRFRDARPDVGKGTQGTSAALGAEADNKFDMSKMKASQKGASPATKTQPAAPAPPPSGGGGGGGGQRSKAGQSQKKKKRSGKF